MARSEHKRWRLKALTLRGFRGISGEQTLRFDGFPAVLHGNNGTGKSTFSIGLHWVLFGRMPEYVLENKSPDKFLLSVASEEDGYYGEVVFQRDRNEAVFRRDSESNDFTLKLDGKVHKDEKAEARRDEMLGLDMLTFVRAVLLQQSRIRGLLLDEPKERNQALDRLLGMEPLDVLGDLAKPKEFETAAVAWREKIENERLELKAGEDLLTKQREAAQEHARELKFLNKDFNPEGLNSAVTALGRALQDTGKKYDVELAPLPKAATVAEADKVCKLAADGIKKIRRDCQLQTRLAPLRVKLTTLNTAKGNLKSATDQVSDAMLKLKAHTKKHGDAKEQAKRRAELEAERLAAEEDLKAANSLKKLLSDALAFVESREQRQCPVCEQTPPPGTDLAVALKRRVKSLASETVAAKEKAVEEANQRFQDSIKILEQTGLLEKAVSKEQEWLDRCRQEAIKAMEAREVPEYKLTSRLDEAISELESEEKKIKNGLEDMEKELAMVELKERNIKDGLIPVLKKRDEIADLEKRARRLEKMHEKDEQKADRMKQFAADIDRIRKAILEAKGELADRSLKRAGPRAQELYEILTRHPFFDTLKIRPTRLKNKVEYSFQVSASGQSGSEREARLVLSDGQMTAAAMGLTYALAETTEHGLDLLYVDDPTQNLDLPSKEAMAKTIAELAHRKQIVVATQDEDFVNYLKSEGVPGLATFHHFREWDGQPNVESSRIGMKA